MKNLMTRVRIAAALLACSMLVGCSLSLSPLAKKTARFGGAAEIVIKNSSSAYDTVEHATYDAQVSSLVLDFDSSGFDRKKIKPFLPESDLNARKALLSGLQEYADQLASVAGSGAFDPLDQQTVALAGRLDSLSENAEIKKLAPSASESQAKGLATAVNALGKVLIEKKRRRELPSILTKMQPVIEQICGLLDADIGQRPASGVPGHGLRSQLWNEYDNIIGNQTDYISDNKARLSPAEKASEIAKLPRLVRQQADADAALAKTQIALRDLVRAHRALLEAHDTGTFKDRISELVSDGQEIARCYNSLNSEN
jgi:hypothetical protein